MGDVSKNLRKSNAGLLGSTCGGIHMVGTQYFLLPKLTNALISLEHNFLQILDLFKVPGVVLKWQVELCPFHVILSE